MHILDLYFKSKSDEEMNARSFATLVIQIGEIIACLSVTLLVIVIRRKRHELMYLMNQLIFYNNHVMELREKRGILEDEFFKNKIREGDLLAFLAVSALSTVQFGITFTTCAPLEPSHIIFKDVFDVEIEMHPRFIPFFLVNTLGFFSFVNIVFFIGSSMVFFYNVTTSILHDITPEGMDLKSRKGAICHVITPTWNVIPDMEVIHAYRVLQLLYNVMHQFMASVLLSFHQVACLSTASILIYFGIQFHPFITEFGPFAYVVFWGLGISPFLLVYLQSQFCGELLGKSSDFKEICVKKFPRKTVFRKFAISCTTINIPYAYPFYNMQKDTFLEFIDQVADYAITLLLW